MSCQPVTLLPASNVQAADPYIFTEPPSIQDLQFYKLSTLKQQHQQQTHVPPKFQQPNSRGKSLVTEKKKAPSKRQVSNFPPPLNTTTKQPLPLTVVNEGKYSSSAVTPLIRPALLTKQSKALPQPPTYSIQTTTPPVTIIPQQPVKLEKISPKKVKQEKGTTKCVQQNRADLLWHAPDSYIFDYPLTLSDVDDNGWSSDSRAPSKIDNWFLLKLSESSSLDPFQTMTRDQWLDLKRAQLRRKSIQYRSAQEQRSISCARKRFLSVQMVLERLEEKERSKRVEQVTRLCSMDNCKSEALVMTAFCHRHITQNLDQKLFQPCAAQYSDKTQCVPVFDIEHDVPLCKEHSWQRNAYQDAKRTPLSSTLVKNQTIHPVNPSRKRIKSSAMTTTVHNPPKTISSMVLSSASSLSSKRVKSPPQSVNPILVQQQHPPPQNQQRRQSVIATNNLPPAYTSSHHHQYLTPVSELPPKFLTSSNSSLSMDSGLVDAQHLQMTEFDGCYEDEFVDDDEEDDSLLNDQTKIGKTIYSSAAYEHQMTGQTDLFNVCENSSAYESSEDTGVGGLSESELIEEIALVDGRLLEEHELNNVLNQFPEDDFSDLFSVQHSDQEVLFDRVLEAVDEHVKLDLGDFLNDQMLEEHDDEISSHHHHLHHHSHLHHHQQQSTSSNKMFLV